MTANKRQTLECINPATGQRIRELQIASAEDVKKVVSAARVAFRSWSRLTVERRVEYLKKARDILLDRQSEMLDLLVEETGKSRTDAIVDILVICETIEYYGTNAAELLADKPIKTRLTKNKRVKTQLTPRGVVVNISPWNYPLDLAWSPLIPALIAGNTVINKPSEVTPLISLKFREILLEAGVPEAVAQVVVGHGDVGAALCKGVDFVCFTGSVATGRNVGVACAQELIPCTLELGGKDAAIVLADADLERTANGIVWGAFFNAGQTCVSIERVYAVEEIYEELVAAIVRRTQSLRQGLDRDFDVEIGSMIFPGQLDIVEGHVRDAVAKGATVRTGGQRNPDFPSGFFYEPTVLTEVTHAMIIMVEETFGPVLPVMKVRDAEEALAHANNSEFGLNGSIWTKSAERGRALARRFEAGNVCINECMVNYVAPEAPFGGIKHSGIGRRKGPDELVKVCHQKTVLEDILHLKREVTWYPYSKGLGKNLTKGIAALYRSGAAAKIRALLG
jgi:succinate-semialdehyde dehydrogenase/glutarate-semialdehyde dehydrogenase